MRVVMAYEAAQGREVRDVHQENLGYDVRSLDLESGELRLIEIKGLAGSTGSILLTPNERPRGRRPAGLLLALRCNQLCERTGASGADSRPGELLVREVTKVQHYWLDVNALRQPMEVREGESGYGGGRL